MKRTLLLLALVVGMAMAEEQEGRADLLKLAKKATLLAPLGPLFEIAIQIVIMIALILLIATLKPTVEGYFGDYDTSGYSGYYPASGYETSGYDLGSGGSSYATVGGGASGGYYKRSVDTPSFMNLPVVQRLAARVNEAIELFEH